MKLRFISVGAAVLILALGAHPQSPSPTETGSVEQEIMKLASDWMDAEVKADMAFLDQFVAEDWEATDPAGNVWTKGQFLAGLKSGLGAVRSAVLDDMKVRVYGDAAVLTGIMTATQTFQGQDISGQYRCTDTLVKKDGRWQCVATHLSMIARK